MLTKKNQMLQRIQQLLSNSLFQWWRKWVQKYAERYRNFYNDVLRF